jgi:hypothetical protein
MSNWETKKQYLEKIVRLFVVKRKQQRYLEYIESHNESFYRELLDDQRDLKDECLIELSKGEKSPEALLAKLKSLGAGKTAFIASYIDEINGKVGNLEEIVLAESFEGNGILIYCVGTKLGYWKDDVGTRYVLKA